VKRHGISKYFPIILILVLLISVTGLTACSTPAQPDRTESYILSATTSEIAIGHPIVFEKSVPLLGEFLISVPPPTFRLSYDLEVELDYPAVVEQGSSAQYKISITKGTVKPVIVLGHGVYQAGPLSGELVQRTFSKDFSFLPGQAVSLPLAPGISIPLTIVATTHIEANPGVMLSKESLQLLGMETQTFEVKPPAGTRPGDGINVVLDFAIMPKIALNVDFKQIGEIVGLPPLPALPGLPSLTWTVAETTLGTVSLPPSISTSVEVIEAPFPIVPIVLVVGLILVVAAIIVTVVLRRRAKRQVGQEPRDGVVPKIVAKETIITGNKQKARRKLMFCKNCGKQLIGTPEICPNCGAKPLVGNSFCQNCGAATNPLAEICLKCGVRLTKAGAMDVSEKSRLNTTLLCILPAFVGINGIHRFYLGKVGTGIAMLLTFGGLGIWTLIDFIFAVSGSMKDKQGKLIKNWE
jgi:TM2 domain-containing membrane protein YozV/RNA polymerase subunit RPABC4/transcription elongation factor Spt4